MVYQPPEWQTPSRPTTSTDTSARARETWSLLLPQSETWHFSRCGWLGCGHRWCSLGSEPIQTFFCPGGRLRQCTPTPVPTTAFAPEGRLRPRQRRETKRKERAIG